MRRPTWRMSSAVRTKETANASTPSPTANSRSSSSFSVSDGTFTGMPGRLMPLFSPSMPPFTISQITSAPCNAHPRAARSGRRREECASPLQVLRQRLEGGAHQRGRALHIARRDRQPLAGHQLHRLVVLQPAGADLRPLQVGQNADRLAAPRRRPRAPCASARAFCSWVPWEKLRRATSTPARTSSRKTSGELQDGPRVATILARRLWSTAGKAPATAWLCTRCSDTVRGFHRLSRLLPRVSRVDCD